MLPVVEEEESVVEETRIDTEEGQVVLRRSSTTRMLRGLGYTEETIKLMSAETSIQIMTGGFLAEYTTVHEDGSFSVAKSNTPDLPRLQ